MVSNTNLHHYTKGEIDKRGEMLDKVILKFKEGDKVFGFAWQGGGRRLTHPLEPACCKRLLISTPRK